MSGTIAYHPGDVVKANLDDSRGKGKVRLLVVLTEVQEQTSKAYYFCACISTMYPEPPPAINFPVPWHPAGSACTGLRKRSAVVLDWVRKVPVESIIHREGWIPSALLRQLYRRLEEYEDQRTGGSGPARNLPASDRSKWRS